MTSPKRDLSALRGGLSGLRQPAPAKPAPPAPSPQPADPTDSADPTDGAGLATRAVVDGTADEIADEAGSRAPTSTPPAGSTARPTRSTRKPAKPAAAPAPGKRPIPVYLAVETKTQLEQLARAEDSTLAEWVLDRLDEYYDELGEVFRPAPTRRSPLPPRQRIVRPRGEASTTVQLRLTGDELAAIEKLRTQLEVPSRSALLARVIELGVERGHGGGAR